MFYDTICDICKQVYIPYSSIKATLMLLTPESCDKLWKNFVQNIINLELCGIII